MAAGFTRSYVEATRDVAGSLEAFEALVPELDRLASVVAESEELRTLLRNPALRRDQKRAVLDGFAARLGLSELGLRLARTLLSNRRLPRVAEVAAAFRDQANRERRVVEASVTTARPIPESAMHDLARAVEIRTGKAVRLRTEVNAALLGGFVIRVGSEVFDASLAQRLKKAKNALHAATGNVPS